MRINRTLYFLKHILFAGFRRSVHAFYLRFLPWSRNTDGKTFYSKPSLLRSVWVSLLHCMPVFHYQAKCRYFTKNFWSYSIRSLTFKFEQVYEYVHLPFILQLFSFHFERFPTADFASTKLNKFGIGNKLGNPGSANSFGVHQGGSAGSMNNGGSGNGLLPESLIWTYVVQLTAALRHIHTAGLACRTLDPTKILVINKTR